jgi:pilus assembly protein CpaF
MLKAGIKKSRFEFLTEPPKATEREVYEPDGLNISY